MGQQSDQRTGCLRALGLADDKRRPRTERGAARWAVYRALDAVRDRFGRESIGYGSVVLADRRAVPDASRELAEREI